ncbi:MAG TPA: MFS transporter [Streptosporangiaceae bacterium]
MTTAARAPAEETIPPPTRLPAFLHRRVGGFPRAFWVLWAGTLINRLGTMVEPFLGLYLTTVRGMSLAQTGLVLAVLGVGSVFAQLMGGWLADRIGRRATLAGSMLTNGLALLALGYADGLAAIVIATLVLGLTLDMYRPASSALVADLVPPSDRPRAYGLIYWVVNLGFAVAMVLGGTLARAGFAWLFWVDALTCAAFAALVWRAVPETRVRRRSAARVARGFADVLRDRVMVAYTLLQLAFTFVLMQSLTTLPLAMNADGLAPHDFGLVAGLNGIVIISVQPWVSPWAARRDYSVVIAAGFLIVGTGYGLTSLAGPLWTYAGTVFVWTLGEILVASVGQAVVADLAPAHLRGRYSGLWGIAWSGGFLLAPLIGTRLLAVGAPVLWLTCAALCTAAAGGQLLLRPAIRRRRAAALVT